MNLTDAVSQREFQVRFTTASAATPGQKQEGFGEFLVHAVSDEEATRLANRALAKLEAYLGRQYVQRQEIRLEDGWHYFTSESMDEATRQEYGLNPQQTDTMYQVKIRDRQ